jgi:hypothetical protein
MWPHNAADEKGKDFQAVSADRPHLPPSMHLETNAGKPWLKSDLLFLKDSLWRGMSLVEVAAFLRRRENEVREKARELEVHLPRGTRKR